MHLNLNPLIFAFLDLPPWSIAIVIPVAGMIFSGVIAGFAMYYNHRREAMWHELARVAIEKGQPIPEPPPGVHGRRASTQPTVPYARSRGYLVGGLINLAVGAGLFVALSQISKPTAYFAAIPFFIGVALLLAALIEMLFSRKSGN